MIWVISLTPINLELYAAINIVETISLDRIKNNKSVSSCQPPPPKNMMDVWCDLIEQKKNPQTNKKIHARI